MPNFKKGQKVGIFDMAEGQILPSWRTGKYLGMRNGHVMVERDDDSGDRRIIGYVVPGRVFALPKGAFTSPVKDIWADLEKLAAECGDNPEAYYAHRQSLRIAVCEINSQAERTLKTFLAKHRVPESEYHFTGNGTLVMRN